MAKYRAICFLAILGQGCMLESNQILRPQDYPNHSHDNIAVYTSDGRRINFPHGQYTFLQNADSIVLRGGGTLYSSRGKYVGVPFNGELSKREVEKIEIMHEWDSSTFAVVLAFLMFVIPLGYSGIH